MKIIQRYPATRVAPFRMHANFVNKSGLNPGIVCQKIPGFPVTNREPRQKVGLKLSFSVSNF